MYLKLFVMYQKYVITTITNTAAAINFVVMYIVGDRLRVVASCTTAAAA